LIGALLECPNQAFLSFFKKRFEQTLQQSAAEGEIHVNVDFRALAIISQPKPPIVRHMLERAFDQRCVDGERVAVERDARGKPLTHHFETNDQIRNDVRVRLRPNPTGDTPRQKFRVAGNIHHEIEHLFG